MSPRFFYHCVRGLRACLSQQDASIVYRGFGFETKGHESTLAQACFSRIHLTPLRATYGSGTPTSDVILQLIGDVPPPAILPLFLPHGCGRTREMIELLSRRWSFYFNASADDLRSGDITTLISDIGMRLELYRVVNNRQASTITYLLLMSRLKILQHCLTISGSHQTFISARWTILQTCPHVLHSDIFAKLFECLLLIFASIKLP